MVALTVMTPVTRRAVSSVHALTRCCVALMTDVLLQSWSVMDVVTVLTLKTSVTARRLMAQYIDVPLLWWSAARVLSCCWYSSH